MGGDDITRIKKAAAILYHRFRNSEQYMKYRGRQHKDDKGNQGEQKWPDRLELAFFEALVRWPPMGRRKMMHKDKQRGRNELIADYIEEVTGEARTRKQVSSHIQVLKPFVEGDPFIMRMLSKEDLCGPGGQLYRGGGRAASYHHDTRRTSTYPGMIPHAPSAAATVPIDAHMIQKAKSLLEVFEPLEFQMFVQQKFKDDSVNRLHTYTQSISDPKQPDDEHLPDWHSLQRSPLLASIHAVRPLDCNVLLAEASLAFPTRSFKGEDGKSLPGVELGISFLCNSRHLPVDAHITCSTNFYHNMRHLKDHSGRAQVQLTESSDRTSVETQLKFGSNFWAKTLATLAGSVNAPATSSRDPRQEVRDHIAGITAAQEVAVRTETGHERLLVIHWKFRLSNAERGRAYWRRLILPQSSSSSTSSEEEQHYGDPRPKTNRNDSVYDYSLTYTDPTPYASASTSQPALQSPFEYDSTSGSGSALTSATWPSMDETNTAPHSAIDGNFPDHAFDFDGGNINLSYDPTLDFGNFDSTAFDVTVSDSIPGTTGAEFGTDPALGEYSQTSTVQEYGQGSQEYSQPEFSQPAAADYSHTQPQPHTQPGYTQDFTQPWTDSYTTTFDSQLSAGASSYPNDAHDSGVFEGYHAGYDPTYQPTLGPPEGQAYGGAGQDAVVKEEGDGGDSLNALADVAGSRFLGHAQ